MGEFICCGNHGFNIIFSNGYNVSVQFGSGNHCKNYSDSFENSKTKYRYSCENAEVAILCGEYPNKRFVTQKVVSEIPDICAQYPKCDDILPNVSSDIVGKIIAHVQNLKNPNPQEDVSNVN